MGSIFSSSHRFGVEKPLRDIERTGKTLKSRKRALDEKAKRKIARKRKVIYIGTKAQKKKLQKERKK